jgi:hypothetical protein
MSTVMSAVRQPTLLIQVCRDCQCSCAASADTNMSRQGEWGDEHGEEFARQFVKELNHVEGGARIHSVKGAHPEAHLMSRLTIRPGASVVSDAPNKPFLAFLASLPYASSPLGPPVPLFTRMARALARLADWMADSEIARRDPTSPLSFSMVPQTAAARRMDVLRGVSGCVIERLLLPHGPDGRPLELCVCYASIPGPRAHAVQILRAARPARRTQGAWGARAGVEWVRIHGRGRGRGRRVRARACF